MWEANMKTLIVLLGFAFAAAPALAQTPAQPIAAAEAMAHVGQSVTVEGAVSNVFVARSGITLLDIGGRYPDNPFTAVIFAADASKFPDVKTLGGKTVDVSGPVKLYKGKPEIVVSDAAQIKAK
jgi:DNA/RNA endonuclease YhcR with UshA esterase domain